LACGNETFDGFSPVIFHSKDNGLSASGSSRFAPDSLFFEFVISFGPIPK
jgi:hypothetical protein